MNYNLGDLSALLLFAQQNQEKSWKEIKEDFEIKRMRTRKSPYGFIYNEEEKKIDKIMNILYTPEELSEMFLYAKNHKEIIKQIILAKNHNVKIQQLRKEGKL